MTGISKSHLNYIEKGEKEPSLSMAVRIAQSLNIKIEELYRIIPQHNFSAILFFVNENGTFVKFFAISTIVNKVYYIYDLK